MSKRTKNNEQDEQRIENSQTVFQTTFKGVYAIFQNNLPHLETWIVSLVKKRIQFYSPKQPNVP
jgi:hypothetical protein